MNRQTGDVRLEDAGNGTWKLVGKLGFTTVSGLLKSTPRSFSANGDIKLDLSGVVRADSAGLALLVEWLRDFERNGRSIEFLNMPGQMQSIARVCGLAEILFDTSAAGTWET
ncbi:MAG: STAS domain-containing protein [Gammaproteobacteria bacterium]|nr:MAG: STAS domain-containing protein [Gammaproteobacteria bacterium]